MSRYQPALFGGLLIGVLSGLPVIGSGNVCCCLWVVSGGVLASYLLQQRTPEPITTSDAMLTGVMAGLIGGVIWVLLSAALMSITGPMLEGQIRRVLEQNPDIPPETLAFVQKLFTGGGMILVQAIILLPLCAIFSLLGALLGTAFFKKKVTVPPAAPPPPMPPQL